MGPGLSDAGEEGMGASAIGHALADARLTTLLLMNADPLETHPERGVWEAAFERLGSLIAFAGFLTPELRENATVIFPAQSNAEKEGTLTHPDGRVQRVRQAIGLPGEIRPGWWALTEICDRVGAGMDLHDSPSLFEAVKKGAPFYDDLTLDEVSGRGARWQDTDSAAKLPAAEPSQDRLEQPPELAEGMRLGAAPSLWSGAVTAHAPSLRFLAPVQCAELAPADAQRLGLQQGDEVVVSAGEESVRAPVALRQAVSPGSVFLTAGTAEQNATALTNGVPRTVEVRKA